MAEDLCVEGAEAGGFFFGNVVAREEQRDLVGERVVGVLEALCVCEVGGEAMVRWVNVVNGVRGDLRVDVSAQGVFCHAACLNCCGEALHDALFLLEARLGVVRCLREGGDLCLEAVGGGFGGAPGVVCNVAGFLR